LSFFDKKHDVRLTKLETERLQHAVRIITIDGFEPKYESTSHFIRCAINHLLSFEEQLSRSQRVKERR